MRCGEPTTRRRLDARFPLLPSTLSRIRTGQDADCQQLVSPRPSLAALPTLRERTLAGGAALIPTPRLSSPSMSISLSLARVR